jgi:hypothetical protein
MIGKVRKRLHGFDGPVIRVCDPSIVRCKLGKVSNERFDEIFGSANGFDVAFGHEYFFIGLAEYVPFFGVLNGLVGDAIIGRKEFCFEGFVFGSEAFAHCLLLIPIPANIRTSVGNPKHSFTDNGVWMQLHMLTREIGTSRTRFPRRHILEPALSFNRCGQENIIRRLQVAGGRRGW